MKEAQQSGVDHQNTIEAQTMREGGLAHRVLSAAEVATIWALLTPTLPPHEHQELRITLKRMGKAQVRGWIIHTVQRTNSTTANT